MILQIAVELPEEMTLSTVFDLREDANDVVKGLLDRYEQYDGASVVASSFLDD